MSIEQTMKEYILELIDKINISQSKRHQINEEETYEYDGLTYMQRKIKIIQKNNMKLFSTSLSGLMKSYSRIEKEQLQLKQLKEEKEENLNEKENYVVYKNDDKRIQPQVIQENNQSNESFLHKKRENPILLLDTHGYTPIKKNKPVISNEEYEDFGSMMSKAIKAKPKIQINKEAFIEKLKMEKQNELNKNKANSTHMELKQVIKIE